MIAVDTNVLVYAHRADSPFHRPAYAVIKALAEGRDPWAIAWPCLHEFLAIVTNPKIYRPPTQTEAALEQVQEWVLSPALVILGEEPGYWELFARLLRLGKIQGAKVHDARVAALCLLHGVDELLSADRDFSRFPELKCRSPL